MDKKYWWQNDQFGLNDPPAFPEDEVTASETVNGKVWFQGTDGTWEHLGYLTPEAGEHFASGGSLGDWAGKIIESDFETGFSEMMHEPSEPISLEGFVDSKAQMYFEISPPKPFWDEATFQEQWNKDPSPHHEYIKEAQKALEAQELHDLGYNYVMYPDGSYSTKAPVDNATYALQQQWYSIKGQPPKPSPMGVINELKEALPATEELVHCPSDACAMNEPTAYRDGPETGTIWYMVQHLNDHHRWSREAVADWCDDLIEQGYDLTFPVPDEIPKEPGEE